MSVLKKYFNKKSYVSPVMDDYDRKSLIDEKGNEYVVYEKVDYPALLKTRGTVDLWSLNALLQAGVNPNFPIRTGLNTRLEGIGVIKDAEDMLDVLLANPEAPIENENKNNS